MYTLVRFSTLLVGFIDIEMTGSGMWIDSCGIRREQMNTGGETSSCEPNLLSLVFFQGKTRKLLTIERLLLVLDVKVSPLAQSIPNRAQMSPA